MRGQADPNFPMFFAIDMNDRIRDDHPLRPIKKVTDEILIQMDPIFQQAYSHTGRPSVAPEVLLKAMLLQCIYSIRSERQLVERIDTDLLFRWFCDMDPAVPMFDATAFTHNRPRMDEYGMTAAFFDAVLARAIEAGLCSEEYFSVDGSLIESYASIKSFQPKDNTITDWQDNNTSDNDPGDGNAFKPRNPLVNFHGQKRSNDTHQSRTDPEAKLYKKGNGQAALLYHMGHAITENRHGLVMMVDSSVADGKAECVSTVKMLDELSLRHGVTPKALGADKGYDSGALMLELEQREIEPHVAMRAGEVGGKTPRNRRRKEDHEKIEARMRMKSRQASDGYALSQRSRKKVEEWFGWLKTIAGLGRSRWVGRWKLQQNMEMAGSAFNLVRMRNLLAR